MGKQELAFWGHNESENSLNRGNYIELLQEMSDLDSELKYHLNNSTVFSGLSNDIPSISKYMMLEIKHKINDSSFVAIIVKLRM